MYRLMRNIHLGLGLLLALVALVFAVSSIVIIYRRWLPATPQRSEQSIQLSRAAEASPRAAALELMAAHGLRGDLRQIQARGDTVTFQIARPGEAAAVTYTPATGTAVVTVTRQSALETLVQLHTSHGFWHGYLPANLWAAMSLLGSVGLLLLGLTGIYLWFTLYQERWLGGLLLGFSLLFACVALLLTRLEQ